MRESRALFSPAARKGKERGNAPLARKVGQGKRSTKFPVGERRAKGGGKFPGRGIPRKKQTQEMEKEEGPFFKKGFFCLPIQRNKPSPLKGRKKR